MMTEWAIMRVDREGLDEAGQAAGLEAEAAADELGDSRSTAPAADQGIASH